MRYYKSFLSKDSKIQNDCIILDDDESRHLIRVFRAATGNPVKVFDGAGLIYHTKLIGSSNNRAELAIEKIDKNEFPSIKVHLIIGILKPKAMDYVFKSAVEIGISSIIPVFCNNASFALTEKQVDNKLLKWRLIMKEACKQSSSAFLPNIENPVFLRDFLNKYKEEKNESYVGFVASLESKNTFFLNELNRIKHKKNIFLAIGPEGDFSNSEYSNLEGCNFHPVTFGKNILRAETAACYGLSVIDQFLHSKFNM